MTTTNGGPTPQPEQQAPSLNVLGQYIKDFSFENPNAPRSLAPAENQPAINIAINVGVQQLGQSEYEVSLKLEGKAENSGTVLFAFDLTFAGMFRLQNVPPEHLQPLLLIECPRLLFPFAREVIATDRKSTRLNSSHLVISYAVFCLKKKKKNLSCHSYVQANHNGCS